MNESATISGLKFGIAGLSGFSPIDRMTLRYLDVTLNDYSIIESCGNEEDGVVHVDVSFLHGVDEDGVILCNNMP
ncbi:unnamed protein product [Dovyalis caffra]|uniref:Uncharacterized protein n=1 Tax=Dovyalis caffra TaxID=77055 RepID=A0AAV1RYA2_9ROSI|nr:unnamed protein product [Dovyalis caffra]